MHDLAIIIPAYKPDYFAAALESLALQTDRRFRVYIGDDAGTAALSEIAGQFNERLDIVYHRFPENLGGESLARHWNRCVQLAPEPWVWVFSDDDVAASECVAGFYEELAKTREPADVYQFQLRFIDAENTLLFIPPRLPAHVSSFQFLYQRIVKRAGSVLPDHIFSRRVFDEHSGFVDFPTGTCSDDAAWMLFARKTGIRRLKRGWVEWRQSSLNISGGRLLAEKRLLAHIMFTEWLLRETGAGGRLLPSSDEDEKLLQCTIRAMPEWLARTMRYLRIQDYPDYAPEYWQGQIAERLGALACEFNARLQKPNCRSRTRAVHWLRQCLPRKSLQKLQNFLRKHYYNHT